jgi:hypothetical protein
VKFIGNLLFSDEMDSQIWFSPKFAAFKTLFVSYGKINNFSCQFIVGSILQARLEKASFYFLLAEKFGKRQAPVNKKE